MNMFQAIEMLDRAEIDYVLVGALAVGSLTVPITSIEQLVTNGARDELAGDTI